MTGVTIEYFLVSWSIFFNSRALSGEKLFEISYGSNFPSKNGLKLVLKDRKTAVF